MKIRVQVKPNSRESAVEKLGGAEYRLKVKASAKEGKANTELVKVLSEYFDIPKSAIIIVKGHKSRIKIVEIQ